MFGNPITGLGLSTAALDVQLLTGLYATKGQQRDFIALTLYGSPAASPFLDRTQYLFDYGLNALDRTAATLGIYTAETIGVGAYLGGSGLLAVKSPFLSRADAGLVQGLRRKALGAILPPALFLFSPLCLATAGLPA